MPKVISSHGVRRTRVNLTLDPELKAWAKPYAKARYKESLSRFIERLLREARAKAQDRIRKAQSESPFARHFKVERDALAG